MANTGDLTIKILMLGGRRCGKTSVLASMQACFDKEFGSSNLTINIKDPKTMLELTKKFTEICEYYGNDHSEIFCPDDSPTLEIRRYDLSISLKSKTNGKINFQFIDFPGEWLLDKEHIEELSALIKESVVYLIAIDTPHLMEQTHSENRDDIGDYNEKRNHSRIISELLKNELQPETQDKLILFIPLKCEKYKAANKMPLVKHKVKIAYSGLINHLNNPHNKVNCTLAVAPIYTLGTVEFKRFKRDAEHNIIIDNTYKTPTYPLYGFMDNANEKPEPQYCEQPLVFVLAFILEVAKKHKNRSNIILKLIDTVREKFFDFPSADDYMKESQNLKNKMKKEDGYEIIVDHLDITKGV